LPSMFIDVSPRSWRIISLKSGWNTSDRHNMSRSHSISQFHCGDHCIRFESFPASRHESVSTNIVPISPDQNPKNIQRSLNITMPSNVTSNYGSEFQFRSLQRAEIGRSLRADKTCFVTRARSVAQNKTQSTLPAAK
jgi:hypothetical protein